MFIFAIDNIVDDVIFACRRKCTGLLVLGKTQACDSIRLYGGTRHTTYFVVLPSIYAGQLLEVNIDVYYIPTKLDIADR